MARRSNKPDGPSTSFQADPVVASLFDKTDDYFGLVLVANWPPDLTVVDPPYQRFLQNVRKCFHKDDLAGDRPSVYLYPTQCLHITIATLHHVQKKQDGIDYSKIENDWTDLVQNASKLSSWPQGPLNFRLASTQLGTKAGILLWTDITGGVQEMRNCLDQEASTRSMKIHSIPGIVHSTFLRFHKVPKQIPGEEIQNRFQELVVRSVENIFEDTLLTSQSAKLVCETTPYMHIPQDDSHILLAISKVDD
eukprot:scaffold603_cov118-Cylindrotheca_fusiformis.AAC.1